MRARSSRTSSNALCVVSPLTDPVETIMQEAPQAVQAVAGVPGQLVPQAGPSFLQRAWQRLRAPSPRSDQELAEDFIAQMLNGYVDQRTAGTSTEAKLGEAVMDCVYAMADTGTSPGATSPIGRLFRSVKTLLGKLRAKMAARPPPQG